MVELLATSFLVKNNFLEIYPMSQSTSGIWICSPPFIKVDDLNNFSKIGEVVVGCLKESKKNVPHPSQDQWKEIFNQVLDIAGIKTRKTFDKNSKMVNFEVDLGKNILSIVPNQFSLQTKSYGTIDSKKNNS